MKYLTVEQIILIQENQIDRWGGTHGIRDQKLLESAAYCLKQTFDGKDLYPTIDKKAAALCYSLANNHPFLDGNKRVAHQSMIVFLRINGYSLSYNVDESEEAIMGIASSKMTQGEFSERLEQGLNKL